MCTLGLTRRLITTCTQNSIRQQVNILTTNCMHIWCMVACCAFCIITRVRGYSHVQSASLIDVFDYNIGWEQIELQE